MAKKKKTKWVQAADIQEGALTAKAKEAGMTMNAFCVQSDLSPKSTKQCNLMKTFARMNRKRG